MGSPRVPDSQSTPPWHGCSELRKKMVVIGNFRARGWVFNFNYQMTDVDRIWSFLTMTLRKKVQNLQLF